MESGPPAIGPVSGTEQFDLIMEGKRAETQAEMRALGAGKLRYRVTLVAIVVAVAGWIAYIFLA